MYDIVTLKELNAAIDRDQPLFLDSETVGLYGKIRLLQAYQKGWTNVLLVEWPDAIGVMALTELSNSVWHNSHYDLSTVQQNTGMLDWCPANFEDTLLLARLALPQYEKFSLDETFQYVLGYCPYTEAGLNKKVLQKSKWDVAKLSDEQLLYAAIDVKYMPELYDAVAHKLEDFNYKLDKLTVRHCLSFQWNGMPVDAAKRAKLSKETQEKIDAEPCPINVNSYQQVRPYIGSDESDDEALARLADEGNEKAGMVRRVRKWRKLLSFVDGKFKATRIYGKFRPGARSGRLTCADQNLQQLPRASKSVFGFSKGAGKVLIYADYAQLELRTICAITECTAMEQLFRDGEDLHGFTAQMMYGDNWTKADRQTAKGYNFCLLYGGGIPMVITYMLKTMGISLNEQKVARDRKRWRNLWKEIFAWQQRGIEMWRKGKLGSTPFGRLYKAKMMTDQLNIENQGAGADVTKLALHYFNTWLQESPLADSVKILNVIHDSFIIEAPDDDEVYCEVAHKLAEYMQEAWFEASKSFTITDLPMPVTVAVDYNWADCDNDEINHLYDYTLEPYAMLKKVA